MKTYWVFPTRKCNLSCKYCYQLDKPAESMSFITADEVMHFIMNDESGREKRVQFFGGEPLLEWEIIERFVKELKGKVAFSITTNGTLLDEKKCRYLKEHNFGFALSLDGPPGVTKKTRPGSEKVDIALVREFFPDAQIIMTLSPENIADGFQATLWFIENGFTKIAHNLATEKLWPKEAVAKHAETFRHLADYTIEVGEKKGIGFMFVGYAKKAIKNSSFSGERNICGSNRNLLAIDVNGDIYPCQDMVTCDKRKRYILGDVFHGYIRPESIPLSEMKFPDREKCRFCWFYHQCVGGCGPKNLLMCGDRFQPIMNGCELYAAQTMEGLRVLLNLGHLQQKGVKRNDRRFRKQ